MVDERALTATASASAGAAAMTLLKTHTVHAQTAC
jgi:hypothetical protein